MSPERTPEARIARRILLVLYFVPTLWLCLGVTVSIVWALAHEGEAGSAVQASPAQGTEALAELRTLYQELRQRAEDVGRTSPRKLVDTTRWEAWTKRWRERLDRIGSRYGLLGNEASASEAGRALQKAFRSIRDLLESYSQVIRSLAVARRGALDEVEAELHNAREALRELAGATAP
jgi:hypothetical protein